jgi:hypothetical protein
MQLGARSPATKRFIWFAKGQADESAAGAKVGLDFLSSCLLLMGFSIVNDKRRVLGNFSCYIEKAPNEDYLLFTCPAVVNKSISVERHKTNRELGGSYANSFKRENFYESKTCSPSARIKSFKCN